MVVLINWSVTFAFSLSGLELLLSESVSYWYSELELCTDALMLDETLDFMCRNFQDFVQEYSTDVITLPILRHVSSGAPSAIYL